MDKWKESLILRHMMSHITNFTLEYHYFGIQTIINKYTNISTMYSLITINLYKYRTNKNIGNLLDFRYFLSFYY